MEVLKTLIQVLMWFQHVISDLIRGVWSYTGAV
jgi:hypothetical protein